jgi:hypothetical protein
LSSGPSIRWSVYQRWGVNLHGPDYRPSVLLPSLQALFADLPRHFHILAAIQVLQYIILFVEIGGMEIDIPATYTYKLLDIVPSFQMDFVFKVKIATDACIALTPCKDVYDGDIYEIIIGALENTVSFIRLLLIVDLFSQRLTISLIFLATL